MKEFQLIKDMEYEYNADVGLSYASPVRGVWNIVHIGTLVPQSHEIFVCPTSCLRGVVLTTAEMGAMDRLSTITVGEDNILEGDMEEALQRGTERVIEELPERPRALLIYTSCIHHFLAVNYHRVYKILRKKYPDIDFIDCYMDPIMRRKSPAVPTLWRQIHRLLTPAQPAETLSSVKETETTSPVQETVTQVNLVGNCFPYLEHSDLTVFLQQRGIKVMDVNTCKTYDEFLTMAASCVNFTFHNTANAAGKDMKIRLGQEWIRMRPGYVYDEIDEDMQKAAEYLDIDALSDEEIAYWRSRAEEAARETAKILNGTPVSVDYTAVDRPLELAVYLLEHGIQVASVYIDVFTESEDTFRKLQQLAPDLKVYQSVGWNIRRMERGFDGKIVGIGQKSAYFHDTNYFVNIVENDGMYGYRGIVRLMQLLAEAAVKEKPMRELVQIKGWGCSC